MERIIQYLKDGFEITNCQLITTKTNQKFLLYGDPLQMLDLNTDSSTDEDVKKCVVCNKTLTIKFLSNHCGCHFHLSCIREIVKKKNSVRCVCDEVFDEEIKRKVLSKPKVSKKKEERESSIHELIQDELSEAETETEAVK